MSAEENIAPYTEWPHDFFETVIDGWQGEILVRPEQGELQERLEVS